MEKIYFVTCGKYRKLKNLKTSYIFEKTLLVFITCSESENEDEKIFKEEESIDILKMLCLIKNI